MGEVKKVIQSSLFIEQKKDFVFDPGIEMLRYLAKLS